MTNQQHPITIPQDLIAKWIEDEETPLWKQFQEAALWGADQELEACCEILRGEFNYHHLAEPLRAARRPKPPSLKAQAIAALTEEQAEMSMVNYKTIRTALDSLPS